MNHFFAEWVHDSSDMPALTHVTSESKASCRACCARVYFCTSTLPPPSFPNNQQSRSSLLARSRKPSKAFIQLVRSIHQNIEEQHSPWLTSGGAYCSLMENESSSPTLTVTPSMKAKWKDQDGDGGGIGTRTFEIALRLLPTRLEVRIIPWEGAWARRRLLISAIGDYAIGWAVRSGVSLFRHSTCCCVV